MDPAALEEIRNRRMAEMKSGGGGEEASLPAGVGGGGGADAAAQARAQAENQEQAKNQMLSQILDQPALVRLSNLAAAKPDKARMVEQTIINMARRGQLAGRMSDEGLKQLLNRVSEQTTRQTTVKFDRRRAAIDSDSD